MRTIGEIISGIILRPHADRIPKLTCSICGTQFYYRGIQDADSLSGSTWDAETETFVPSGSTPAVCTECQKKLKGGYYDGKTVGDLR